ncbi:MAG: type III-B CRISPR module RAMP protein Cmr6 [Euryarchaeota archaeon]
MTERPPEKPLLSRLQEAPEERLEELKRRFSTLCSVLLHYGLPGALVLAEKDDVKEALLRLPLDQVKSKLGKGLPEADRLTTRLADLARNAAEVGEPRPTKEDDGLRELRRRVAEALELPDHGKDARVHPYHEKRTLALRALAEKYGRRKGRRRKERGENRGGRGKEESLRQRTRKLLERVVSTAGDVARSDEISGYVETYLEALKGLDRCPHLHVCEVEIRFPNSKLVVGMGGPHPAENDLALDPVTGLPVIPGTALKGVARAAGELILSRGDPGELGRHFGTDDPKEAEEVFRKVFGSKPRRPDKGEAPEPERAGAVAFHDALPDPKWLKEAGLPLEVDVINPHYKAYYDGEEPPHESIEPNPVEFLVVRRGSRWRTVLVSESQGPLKVALKLLKYGVERLGVGARTCAGYGYGEVKSKCRLDGDASTSDARP